MLDNTLNYSLKSTFMILVLQTLCLAHAKGLSQKSEFQETLSFSNSIANRSLEVDNVFGSVTVEGYSGDSIQITYTQTLTADRPSAMEEAIRDTRLAISQKENHVLLYAEAPYRNWERNRHRDYGYQAHYDIVVKVPSNTRLNISTVNEGNIYVRDVTSAIEVSNVNGTITLETVSDACHATTVNGEININFQKTPGEDCLFKTVNGDISLSFPAEPHGDYHLKTFNGEMYSDFDYEPIRSQSHLKETHGRLTKITMGEFVRIRIGAGGPQFQMDTLNGDIFIRAL